MTEAEWLVCDDPTRMLAHYRHGGSRRKFQLVVCAACRSVWPLLITCLRHTVEVSEQYADGELGDSVLAEAARSAWATVRHAPEDAAESLVSRAAALSTGVSDPHFAERAIGCLLDIHSSPVDYLLGKLGLGRARSERLGYAALVRDIFGNPFRSVGLSPEWRTGTVVALARQMYESRDFSAMPILADALQDAGCDNDEILTHCRDPKGRHARGCWAVDLVLGKG